MSDGSISPSRNRLCPRLDADAHRPGETSDEHHESRSRHRSQGRGPPPAAAMRKPVHDGIDYHRNEDKIRPIVDREEERPPGNTAAQSQRETTDHRASPGRRSQNSRPPPAATTREPVPHRIDHQRIHRAQEKRRPVVHRQEDRSPVPLLKHRASERQSTHQDPYRLIEPSNRGRHPCLRPSALGVASAPDAPFTHDGSTPWRAEGNGSRFCLERLPLLPTARAPPLM